VNTTPLRVLCIDDDPDVADSAALVLEGYGCVTAACYDGPSALAETLRFGPDVCLIDLSMPGMDGCEVARRLKAWRWEHPVHLVAVTAHGSDAARAAAAAAGFDRHLVKPVDWDELRPALARLAHAPRLFDPDRPG
jgi:CheY-like chemotaxis protein